MISGALIGAFNRRTAPPVPADPRRHRWTQLYGVVVLEVMGHLDPHVIESGELFLDVIRRFVPTLQLEADLPRLEAIIRERWAR